jgi:hypothetical protein
LASDRLVARPLPKHRTTQTQNKHIHTSNNHALCGIRTQDPSFRASEDSSCLRPLGYCDRLVLYVSDLNFVIVALLFNVSCRSEVKMGHNNCERVASGDEIRVSFPKRELGQKNFR